MPAKFQSMRRKGKGQNFYARIYDPSRHPSRKEIPLKTTNKTVARQRFTELERRNAMGKYDPWNDAARFGLHTFEEVKEGYMKVYRRDNRPESADQVGYALKNFGKHIGPSTPIQGITPDQVRTYLDSLTAKNGEDPASPHTRAGKFAYLEGFFRWSRGGGYMNDLPTAHVTRPKKPPADRTALRPEHIETTKGAVIAACETSQKDRTYILPVIEFLTATGLRRSELVYLNWRDVDLSSGLVHVRRWSHPTEDLSFVPKHDRSRKVPLFPRARKAIREATDGRELTAYDPVFVSAKGGRLHKGYLSKMVTWAFAESYEELGATTHWLRHTFISWMVNDLQRPISLVQRMVGHEDYKTTEDYLHVSTEDVMSLVEERDGQMTKRGKRVRAWLRVEPMKEKADGLS